MSSVGQGLGGIVGGAIGFMVGGPSGALYGAQVGMMVGGLLDPPKVEGPRLEDLIQQTSAYGVFIPRAYGTVALHGNVFWIQGDSLIERGVESSGKGGPEVTNYEYYASFAVSLCEGTIDGIRRIWIGGQLWYDAGSDDLSTIIASNESAYKFTLYTGTETQEVDPLIQADRGVTNVPAYRGIAYIVFNELPLKDVGNTIAGAQVKVEVIKDASVLGPRSLGYELVNGYPLQYRLGYLYRYNDGVLSFYADNLSAGSSSIGGEQVPNDEKIITLDYAGNYFGASSKPDDAFRPQLVSSGTTTIQLGDLGPGTVWWPERSGTTSSIQNGVTSVIPWGSIVGKHTANVSGSIGDIANALTGEAGRYVIGIAISSDGGKILVATGATSRSVYSLADRYFVLDSNLAIVSSGSISGSIVGIWGIATTISDPASTVIDISGENGWTTKLQPAIGFETRYFSIDSAGVLQVGSQLQEPVSSVSSIEIAYYSGVQHVLAVTNIEARIYAFVSAQTITGATVLLGEIVESESIKSDLLTASDLDVTDLTEQVRGYRVGSLGPLRGGIDPLRKAWPFDVVQHGYQIKFKTRGSSSVATITEAELDAREAGAAAGVQITNIREMDTVLPDQLTIKYLDAAREYDINVAEQTR